MSRDAGVSIRERILADEPGEVARAGDHGHASERSATPARNVVRSFKLYAALRRGATEPKNAGIRLLFPSRPAPSPAKISAPGVLVTGLIFVGSKSEVLIAPGDRRLRVLVTQAVVDHELLVHAPVVLRVEPVIRINLLQISDGSVRPESAQPSRNDANELPLTKLVFPGIPSA